MTQGSIVQHEHTKPHYSILRCTGRAVPPGLPPSSPIPAPPQALFAGLLYHRLYTIQTNYINYTILSY